MNIEELVKFLEASAGQAEADEIHRKLLNAVINQLPPISVKSPAYIYREVRLRGDNNETIGIVDVAVLSTHGDLYLIEAKAISLSKLKDAKREMRKQLQKYYGYFMEKFGISSITIGVYRTQWSAPLKVDT